MSQANERLYTPNGDMHIGGLGPHAGGTLTDYYLDAIDEEPAAGTGEDGDASDWLERTRTALRDADRFVHESPWRALGVVAAVSFVAGLLLARRN
jgi:hypothetical protein